MNTQTHRTCIRMSQEEYDLLKEKSRAAGLSANAWLMRELERNFEYLAIPAAVHCAENRVRQPCRTLFSPASGCRFFTKLST